MAPGSLPPRPLSPDREFDQRLRTLLEQALPRIPALAADLQPRLLVLMGSAAVGEASAVRHGAGFLPLSDLDLGLFVERAADAARRRALQRDLSEELRTVCAQAGLETNPLDVGIFPLFYLRRMPVTLEIGAVLRHPVVLWGDRDHLDVVRLGQPRPFEALRLALNRVSETLLPPYGAPAPLSEDAEHGGWAAEPGATEWAAAHRWSKLALDGGRALLASRGADAPTAQARLTLLTGTGPGPGQAPLPQPVGEALARWTGWRREPSWPPPQPARTASAWIAAEVIRTVSSAAGGGTLDPGAEDSWRRLLRTEGGWPRERVRRWIWMIQRRPQAIGLGTALPMALRWWKDAWPATLGTLALALAWIDQVRERGGAAAGARWPLPPGGNRLRRVLRRAQPLCGDLPVDRWQGGWGESLAAGIGWIRGTGA